MRVHCQSLPLISHLLPIDQQAAHSSNVANKVYARAATEILTAPAGTEQEYYFVSTMWQQLLGLSMDIPLPWKITTAATSPAVASTSPAAASTPSSATPTTTVTTTGATTTRQLQLRGEAIALLSLRKGFPESNFTSPEQRKGIVHTLQERSDLLFISPTGSGKTLLYFLPALTQTKTVVVIVPLVALRLDLLFRATTLKIDVAVWNDHLRDPPALLLVSPEIAATSTAFSTFLRSLDSCGRLLWLVFEEAHLFLTSAYRPHLKLVLSLTTTDRAPVLFLTATMPPYLPMAD